MRLLHPLAGSNVSTFVRLLARHRPFEGEHLLRAAVSLLAVATRFPFYSLERITKRERIEGPPPPEDPIFIVGHWRSGTTHLHNLISRDEQFATVTFRHTALPWDFLNEVKLGAQILDRALPEDRGMDKVALSLHSPQEEEMALGNMGPLCYYNCYYFPHAMTEEYRRSILLEGLSEKELEEFAWVYRYLLSKLAAEVNHEKRLLLKNPASTARILWLKTVFPQAKFVHIRRNPFEVYTSTVKHYDRIMPDFSLQTYEGIDFETATLNHYRWMMERYLQDLPQVPKEDLVEVTYEEVTSDPLGAISNIYEQFDLPNREAGLKAIGDYGETIANYRRNVYTLKREQVERIEREWGFALDRWGYARPEGITVAD